MKQLFLILILCAVAVISVSAQKTGTTAELSAKQWQELFTALGSENWTTAFDLSDKYLKLLKDDDNAKSIANLRYIYLYAAAGKVFEGKMSYDELEKSVKNFIGKRVVMPFRQFKQNCKGEFNYICSSSESKNKVLVSASNKAGTSILAFEYTQLKEDFDFAKHEGEEAAISGVIDSIVPNPNRSTIVILRIYITDGVVLMRNEKMQKVVTQ